MWNMAGCSYNKLGIFLFLHKWVLGNSLVEKLCSPELRNSVKDTGEQMPSLLNLFNEDTRFPFFTSVGIWGRSRHSPFTLPLSKLRTANDQDR